MQKNLSTILVSSLALAACGGGGSTASPPAVAVTPPPPPPPPVTSNIDTALESLNLKEDKNSALKVGMEEIDEENKTALLSDIEIEDPNGNYIFTLDELSITGLERTNGNTTLASMNFVGLSLAPRNNGYAYSVSEIELTNPNPSFALYLAAAFIMGDLENFDFSEAAFDGINLSEVSIVPVGSAADEPNKVSFELDALSLTTAVNGVVEVFAVDGLDTQLDLQIIEDTGAGGLIVPANLSIEAANVDNYRLNDFNEQLTEDFSGNDVVVETITTLIGSPIDLGHDGFSMTNASLSVAGLGLSTTGFSTDVTRDSNGVTVATNTPRAEFAATVNTNEPLGELLDTYILSPLSIETPVFYTQSSTAFDPATDTTTYNDLEIGIVDSFGVGASGQFGGFAEQAETLALEDGFDIDLFNELKVIDGSFSFIDDGLSDALLGLLGGDGTLIRFAVRTAVGIALETNSLLRFSQPILTSTLTDLDEWLQSGGKLSVSIDPINPISLADLSMFDISAEEIGWETTVEALD